MMLVTKKDFIEFFRANGFNPFPIPEKKKVADYRYRASKTIPNQIILPNENYGIIPLEGSGCAIIDFDSKEKYKEFAQHMIQKGFMVIESPHGWHMPVRNLTGQVSKTELFDYDIQNTKIIEIQGSDHYCVGAESEIIDEELQAAIKYKSRGSELIFDAKGIDFNQFIDDLCVQCNVEPRKRDYRSSYKHLRDRFVKGEIPLKGSSNDYFFQAGIQCNTDGLSKEEAMDKIFPVYQKWSVSQYFSGRPWENIIRKIEEVYEKNLKAERGRPKTEKLDRTQIAEEMIKTRKLFSNVETHDIFENKNGFLEKINNTLKRELHQSYSYMNKEDYNDILFKLEGMAEEMPETNKNLIVFKNGVFDRVSKMIIETDEIADMGFKNYEYLQKSDENMPTEFIKVLFDNVPEGQHKRIRAGLKSIFVNYLDPKISIIYGQSGVGKSTPLAILTEILGDYALTVELKQFLDDKFIKAKINGKRLLVFQDLPKEWKDFTTLKTLTGEQRKTERGFMQDSATFDNKLKIWASGNYLANIPEDEKDAMYTRRLSLIHNTKTKAYKEDPTLADKIVKEEEQKIISWVLNFSDDECMYEDSETVKREWENISSPEIEYLEKYWTMSDIESNYSIKRVVEEFKRKYKQTVSVQQMAKSLKGLGYEIKNNIIKNITELPPQKEGI